MRRTLIVALSFALWISVAVSHEPGRDMAAVELGDGKVTIDYGTPQLKERNLDEMIQPGVPWRMGMNAATTLETTVSLDFSGKRLGPGKYTLYARPDEQKNWSLLISTASGNRFDPSTIVVEAPLEFEKAKAPVDVLKITLAAKTGGAELNVAWGHYRLRTMIKAV